MNALSVIGAVWALPCSLVGWAIAAALGARVHHRLGTTFVFVPPAGSWLDRQMHSGDWAGFSAGDVIVVRLDQLGYPEILDHELRHTAQVHVLGLLVIPAWILGLAVSFVIAFWHHLYWNHPFELDARRDAERAAAARREASRSQP